MFADVFERLFARHLGASTAEPASLYDRMHALRLLYEEVHRTHVAFLRHYLGARHDAAPPEPGEEALFAAARATLLEHPVAAQALFRALADEGRRYLETEPGRHDWALIRRSTWLARLRHLWSDLTLNLLEDRPATVVPSMYLDLVHALVQPHRETPGAER